MKRSVLRPVAVGIATLSTVATMVIGAASSQAASIGSLTFTPASGFDSTPMSVATTTGCPFEDDGTGNNADTNLFATISGPGFSGAVNVVGNSPQSNYAAGNGLNVPFADTLQDFASSQSPVVTLNGTYAVSVECAPQFGAPFASFDGSIAFTNTGQKAGAIPYAAVVAVQNYTTTTALASTPASPVNTGASVSFTAHVTSSPAGGATGTVQLLDGATAIGSPTAVDASGNATIATSFATAGSHSITAAFTGSAANVGNSASTAIVYTVNQSPATPTTTGLAISPATADANTPVTLTASVAPTAAAGTVQFSDGGTAIGTPVTVAGGTATLTQTFAAGAHSFAATFTPTNPASFSPSAATSQALTVTPGATNVASSTLETTVNAGSLTISVADSSKVILPSPALNATATYLTTSGNIHPVAVSDTRAGNPGWTVSGQVSDFLLNGDNTKSIAGSNLGWTPKVSATTAGQTVVAGAAVTPETGPVTSNPAADDTFGLHFGRTLASAAAGHGTGFTQLDAALALNVPTTTVAGTYDATLTLTAI